MTGDGAVDSAIDRARERVDLPEEDGELTFDAPWQARAFATVVALHNEGLFEWREFQARLIDNVQDESDDTEAIDAERDYYEHWLAAVEDLLREKGVVEAESLRQRTSEFVTGERDASEFVVGVDHAHDHTHHDHSHHEHE